MNFHPPGDETAKSSLPNVSLAEWVSFALSLLIVLFFFGFSERYGKENTETVFSIWSSAWNQENDFTHGWLFPPLVIGLIFWKRKEIAATRANGSIWGLGVAFLGCALYLLSYRTLQWRIAVIGLPLILSGIAYCYWGKKTACSLAFPFFLTWLAIPMSFIQHATGGLQLIASKLAYYGCNLINVPTYLKGNELILAGGTGFMVDEGCSGIRSLWALMLIAASWTYVAKFSLTKKAILFLSAFPIAILGNALRIISICALASKGNIEFAEGTWHDWSPLILFYPISLILLLATHSLLEGGLPWKKSATRKLRRIVVSPTNLT